MQLKITKQMFAELSAQKAEHKETFRILSNYYNIDDGDYRWGNAKDIVITTTPHDKLRTLAASFKKLTGVRGHKAAYQTINTWLGAQDNTGLQVAKNVQQFSLLLIAFMAKQPHQRVYVANDDDGFRAYHLSSVRYFPPTSSRGRYSPPYVQIDLAYKEFGTVKTESRSIGVTSCVGKSAIDGLRACRVFLETDELRAQYLEEHARWDGLVMRIGHQCLARGQADDGCDGNPSGRKGWWWEKNIITLDQQNEPSRVVVDVFQEEEKEKSRHNSSIDLTFWTKHRPKVAIDDVEEAKAKRVKTADDDDDDDVVEIDDEADEEDEVGAELAETDGIEIPTYPMLVVFDMKRHLRLRVHVSQLEDYVYDTRLGTRLILPADVRDLVGVLLGHKTLFTDVIAGKGGGVVVLCAGPPGTGKTLTAEIYAEVMKRPLYAVQTAQLGLDAAEVENELRKVFARAFRWGAILLLDEADVYVRARENDLAQNAIVGVFLRTLEYYQGVLFLTTNRAESIDDAIASRCIARIDYGIPHIEDQKKIWRVLADSSNIAISDEVINEVCREHSDLSGRDIKNLVKLAHMVSIAKRKPITAETITFVKRFKPTGPGTQFETREGGGLELTERKPRLA